MSRARDLADLGDGIAVADLPSDVVTTASPSLGRRNLIINGAMQVAQRGTTSSSTGYQTVDRWRLNLGTQQEQKTDTPDQFKNSMEVTGTVAGSSGYGILLQRIESNNIYAALGQSCTLSCYVKNTGTSTANVSVEVYRANTTDNFGAITLVSSLTSQAITTGWTRITFPAFTVPTTASTGLEVRIFRYDASNDQEWLITGVQLEVGSVATPFEHRSYGEELALCQRYYELLWAGGGGDARLLSWTFATNDYRQEWLYKVEKRADPSFGLYTGAVWESASGYGTPASFPGKSSCGFYLGNGNRFYAAATTSGNPIVYVDAEL